MHSFFLTWQLSHHKPQHLHPLGSMTVLTHSLTHSMLTVTMSVEQHLDEIVMGVPGLIP